MFLEDKSFYSETRVVAGFAVLEAAEGAETWEVQELYSGGGWAVGVPGCWDWALLIRPLSPLPSAPEL